MNDLIDLEFVTRMVVALAYFGAGLIAIWSAVRSVSVKRPGRWFLAVTLMIWAVWYVVLAFVDPPMDPWSILNRALHIPLTAAIAFNVWVANKEHHRLGGSARDE